MPDVLIVGGGLAGLTAANYLHQAGSSCQVVEAADDVGGRVRTDSHEGFLLDRGFQVFLTAYPEARQLLDYSALDLQPFEPGALVHYRGKLRRFTDPWRRPSALFSTVFSPLASLSDKLRVALLRGETRGGQSASFPPDATTLDALRSWGFGERIIERFFRPFLGGIFLESQLATSAAMFAFVFGMFSSGDAALPAGGMQQIPQQLAKRLPADALRTNCRAESVRSNQVTLAGGDVLSADAVIVAADQPAAKHLGGPVSRESVGVHCLYFAVDRSPVEEATLVLNADDEGPINNLCVPSQVARGYAPAGQALVSVSVLEPHRGDESLLPAVLDQLRRWFGAEVERWQHLRTYTIPFALPRQPAEPQATQARPARREDGVYQCGDYLDTASINGAMASGRRAAEAVLQELQ